MFTLAFWNLNNQQHAVPLAAELAREHTVDVLVVAECSDPAVLLSELNARSVEYHLIRGRSRVDVFTRFSNDDIVTVDEHNLFTIRLIALPDRTPLLLAAAHLSSGLNMSLESRDQLAREFARQVADAEMKEGIRETVVIGDLNLNPFDAGIAHAGGFHAVMDRRIAAQSERVIHEVAYSFFYNPMWRFFGDDVPPPGSYYYRRAEHSGYFWTIYDQVLIRPTLLPMFRDDCLLMPARIGITNLLNHEGRPDSQIASDHLPIILGLDL